MNKKEKAEELFDKYCNMDSYCDDAKECALITVDEFISYFSEEGFKMAYPEIAIREIEYWNGVKQELNSK